MPYRTALRKTRTDAVFFIKEKLKIVIKQSAKIIIFVSDLAVDI